MYDEIFEAFRKEKENIEIQVLQKSFFLKLSAYIKRIHKEKRMLDKRTVKAKLIQKEEENVKYIVKELVQVRFKKIMCKILKDAIVPLSLLTEEEEMVFREAASYLDSFRAFTNKLLQGRLSEKSRVNNSGLMVVRILQEIPEIIGANMKIYGPFKPEDITNLPKENARILIKQGVAMEVKKQ